MTMSASGLVGYDFLLDLYDCEDDLEKERKKALYLLRAKELGVEPLVKKVLKAYSDEEKKLEAEHKKLNRTDEYAIKLKRNEKEQVLNTIENYLTILREDKHFSAIKYNLLTDCPETTKNGKTTRWSDADDAETREYIEKRYKIHNQQKLDDALRMLFKERAYHPIREVIEAAEWDGKERIETLLTKYMKCENSPYTREVSRLIFAGGINRLYNPGCKFDDVPVLIGTKQGEGKSTFVRWLALDEQFFTEVTEIEGQKGIEAIEGAWICEIAELLALTRTKDVEAVKSYITKLNDRYRKPFDKRVTEHPRQCIFIGTTNKEQFLTDKTGNRRFYPVKVNQIGYELFKQEEDIKADIIQCWAEAKAKFDKGEMKPFADQKLISEIRQHQSEAVEDDYRVGLIQAYLENKYETCVLDLWKNAFNELGKPKPKDSLEIGLIMQNVEGWKKADGRKYFTEFGRQRYWQKLDTDFEEICNDIDF